MKKAGGFPIYLIQPHTQLSHRVVALPFRHLQTDAVGKETNRLHIIQMLNFSDKRDNVAPGVAAKAVKCTVIGVNIERRRFFPVKGAKPDKVPPGTAKIHIGGNHILNAAAELELLNK